MWANRQVCVFLILIVLVGTVLRVYRLNYESLWQDELHTALTVNSQLIESFNVEPHPFLYYILIYSWSKIFSDSDVSLRSFSVIFGIISIFLIFLVSRLLFDYKVGLLSSFILAISEFHIFYSQEAKMYSLLTFFDLLSIYFFIIMLRSDKFKYKVGYFISTIFCIFTHYYGIFIPLIENLYFFSFKSKKSTNEIKRWIFLQTCLFIPWAFLFIKKMISFLSPSRGLGKPNLYLILNAFNNESGKWGIIFIFLFLCGVGSLVKKERNKKNTTLLLLWLFFPILISYIFSLLFFSILHSPRYVIFCSIPYYILIAKGIIDFKWRFLKAFLVIGIMVISLYTLKIDYTTKHKTDWKSVTNYLKQQTTKKEAILVLDTTWIRESMKRYYKGKGKLILLDCKSDSIPDLLKWVHLHQDLKENKEFILLKRKLENYHAFWFVYVDLPVYLPAINLYKKNFDKNFEPVSSVPLYKAGEGVRYKYGIINAPIKLFYYKVPLSGKKSYE